MVTIWKDDLLWKYAFRHLGGSFGGNDLPRVPRKALILDILRYLNRLHALYPTMRIVWSTIIPRLNGCGAQHIEKVNKACQVNKEVCGGVSKCGLGSVINHRRFQISNLEYFHKDGVHLSDAGLGIFLEDI